MSSGTILYVEDELFLGKIVKESLESRGYHVIMESDGAQVVEQFRQCNPDVCVLDVMLPGVDGFTLAAEIRQFNENIPIIFLTAKTQTTDLVKGFSVGGNDYIRKPFSMEELIVRIENVLRKKSVKGNEEAIEVVNIGKYSFHFVRQTLSSGMDERKLSFRESELLRLLYAHRDRIIDRKEILNLLWGNDSFFNSRNLDVYITKLRSYLREDERLSIITIKGVGYRFAVGG
ncbi:response regulator transcription factor [Pseudobacter ginsenosidimutans]|jgi:DNA-binding response OmpR family regulator|uniref:DNA-binding response OmpR family regulator n=1 Tax=Pseudobacter ginsenosidimutans TaxID=661488 RepID=A0A4Q7MSV5_9BACT|nr:response regulator transcription factor [Pseudobacter ginsenosidimutans]QEC41310.1 response regulator transcription factor [Pseudobacter ginsenosidimutans]RZS71916.1 DNA-binding response OmpR family regulator [Pseudobacter ginsenosidimutans]